MSTFLQRFMVCLALVAMPFAVQADDYQLPDPGFEDWSGSAFDGQAQPKYWHGSNVEQVGFKFNFTHKETGRSGSCVMVQDQKVGALGITETGPGYFSMGTAWQQLEGVNTGSATAGTKGGYAFKHRPDTISVWIKRTGSNADKENYNIVYYSWIGTSEGTTYKNKSGGCTGITVKDEESDIRVTLDGNECNTKTAGEQVGEAWKCEKKQYNNWTNIRIPVFYMDDRVPEKCNLIFSASNYPNFRANSGLYEGNSLYVDDVELIYSSKIHKLLVDGKEWKGFDPNSSEEQVFSVKEGTTKVPEVAAYRGVGSLTNEAGHGKFSRTYDFYGRKLSGSEISIVNGTVGGTPTVITVKSEDGKSTTVYKIKFQAEASSNAKLAAITYTFMDMQGQQQTKAISNFNPGTFNYEVELPYGSQGVPSLAAEKQEDEQTLNITQPTSLTGTGTIAVTAANGSSKQNYKVTFKVGLLADNTLKDIKVNRKSIPGFTPSQAVYKVSQPTGTKSLTVEPVSAYPAGQQTVVITPNPLPTGEAIDGTTVQVAVTTPGNTVAKVYKLNIRLEASSYTYLADLKAGDYITNFTPDNFTYYVNLPLGTTMLPEIKAIPGDEYQSVQVSELGAGVVDGTVRVTVTAGNGDQTVYKIVFATEKSDNSELKGIEIGGVALEGFSPSTTSYTVQLPVGTTVMPEIKAIPGDEYQNINVATGGVNGKTRITVTAGNGSTTIYQIAFSVETFSNNKLASLTVANHDIAFDPETDEYWVNLPQGTTVHPAVEYTLVDANLQKAAERDFSGAAGDYRITVRPQSGASRTYIIHFTVATSSNTALADLKVEGYPFDFDSLTLDYTIHLAEGVSKIPTVTFVKAEPSQRVLSVLENRVQTITVTAESGAKRDYTITFIVQVSQNAFLDMIYLDSVPLPGFRKDSMSYEVSLTGATCPVITVDKAAGQQVTITAPYAAGEATIKVKPEEGAANTYTIVFTKQAAASARLDGIKIDGTPIAEFSPEKMSYDASYQGAQPVVEGIKQYTEQQVNVLWKENVAWVYVTDTLGNKAAYHVTFTQNLSGDNGLEAIYADGALIDGFKAEQLNYSYGLAAGSNYPEISYKAKDNTQVVFFGQVEEGKWAVLVQAENGDTTTYTVKYTIAQYADATLKNILLNGTQISGFAATKFDYTVQLDNGADLPELTVEAREGQTIIQTNSDATHQQIIVYAESGATNTYSITYTRVQSKNTKLADILLNGESLAGFDPDVTNYIDSLAWRSNSVPNVFPVGQVSNQTITTYHSRPNGVTRIHVVAENGDENDYYIAFPVKKSGNTKLKDMYLGSEDAEIKYKADTLNYTALLPYGTTVCPAINYEKAENEQRVDVISRPIGQKTDIIVTAENGDTRTYTILFKIEPLKDANRLTGLRVMFDNDPEKEQELSLKDKAKRIFDVTVPYNSRQMKVTYEKNYEEQTVFVYPGGVKDTTYIVVKANNGDVADEVYKLHPVQTTQNPAVLNSIKVDGVDVPGFDPNRFTYIVNRTVSTYPKVTVTRNSGVEYDPSTSLQKWVATVEKDGFSNTYKIFFHYTNDVIPNAHFTDWTTTVYNSGNKPTGWNVPADFFEKVCVFSCSKTGAEIVKTSNTVVGLETTYWSAAGGALPAIITLGKLSGAMSVDNKTHYEFYDYMDFRNTPDAISVNYKHQTQKDNGAFFAYRFKDANNEEYVFDFTDKTTNSSYITKKQNLTLDGKPIVGMNIAVDATNRDIGASGGAKLYIDWFELHYNSAAKAAKVNGIDATKSGSTFTVTLTDPEDVNIRSYEFNGEVSDQAQELTWSSPVTAGDYKKYRASVKNYAEDGTFTTCSLEVKRPFDTRNTLDSILINGIKVTGFMADKTDYTVNIGMQERIPDVISFPSSSLQTVKTTYDEANKKMTIVVTPEKGTKKTYTVTFVPQPSSDATLKAISADGLSGFEPTTTSYDITAAYMPIITFEKQMDAQTVEMINGVLKVTAEDGVTTKTYTINRLDPTITPNGVITQFNNSDETKVDGLGGTITEKNAAKPADAILFTRAQETDSVIFVQSETNMQWYVPETSKTYTWTYTTEKSDNANLATFTVDGTNYGDFSENTDSYELTSDTTLLLAPIAGHSKQQLATSSENVEGGVEYTTIVTAENGIAQKTYKIKVLRPMSNDASLAGILLDGVMLSNFHPDTIKYTVTLPVGDVKRENPKMPSITYLTADKGQKVQVKPGTLNEEETNLFVTSEDGKATRNYDVMINVEKSHCVDLTGITVNGVSVDQFEPGRHFYSQSLNTSDITIDYTTDDRFQTINIQKTVVSADHRVNYTLHVTAENGATADYLVEIYIENQSSDAQLANIMLNGQDFVDFERALNSKLAFDGGNNNYEINLPSGTTVLPEVSAQLKMDGQKVEITQKAGSIELLVTAVDGVTTNTYVLTFVVPLSTNADLSMIFLDGDSLPNFDPTYYFYQIDLPVGVHTMPEVAAQKGEAGQTIKPIAIDTEKWQATIKVQAEDPSTRENTYVVVFHVTLSDADTLEMIYQDGQALEGFRADSTYYSISLPVGTAAFPDLSWQEADELQTVKMETVETTENTLIRQIIVTSESGKKNTYTVSYTIEKSDVDTLQMIFIDQKRLETFQPRTNEYNYQLTAAEASALGGALPTIEYIQGDEAQTVFVSQTPDSVGLKSLGYKSIITVTAATGKTRTYTIHYPVELSDDATLNMINVSGKPLSNFDAERFIYRLEIEKEASVPVVSVIKKEDAQTYDISVIEDTVQIVVYAEDMNYKNTYTLTFERLKSAVTTLRDIILTDENGEVFPSSEFPYRPEVYSYIVNLTYDDKRPLEEQLPTIEPVGYDEEQVTDTTMHYLPNGDIQVDITVTAPNGEDQAIYSITFHFVKPADATLAILTIGGEEFADFRPTKTGYTYYHPYGTDSAAYFTQDDVLYMLNDSLATDTIYTDEDGLINIVVTAQDGRTSLTYQISQATAEDGDNALLWITIDGDTVAGFDPETLFYTYYMYTGDATPTIDAAPRSINAEVDLGQVKAGDTCTIICTAADGQERIYRIHFAISSIVPGADASSNDVLIKRVPGSYQFMAATMRNGVTIALYDQNGRLVYYRRVPVANANDADVVIDANNKETLNNVIDTRSGLLIDVIPGQPYFYSFFWNEKTKLVSGKLMAL